MSAHLAAMAAAAETSSRPLSALLELTGRCNLDCAHCYLDIAHPPEELSTAEALRVVDELQRAGTLFLSLSGGELFLRPDALRIAEHARRRGLAVKLYTNATRVTRALAAEIARLRPLAVEVSLYGPHHERVTRRPRSLRRTLRGLAHLRRAGVPLVLKSPLMDVSTPEALATLTRWAARLGAQLKLDPFVKARLDGERAPTLLRADDALLVEGARHPALARASLPSPPAASDNPCAIGRRSVRIAPNGDVFPCVAWPEPAGNVRARAFADIWAGGPLLDALRGITFASLRGACAGCGQQGYCGRCLAMAERDQGDRLGPADEACRWAAAQEVAAGVRAEMPAHARRRLRVVA